MNEQKHELVECDGCEEMFDIEVEGFDYNEEYYCSHCEWEHTYLCVKCECQDMEDRKGEIGSLLMVGSTEETINLTSGVYEITSHPYYGGPLIGGMEIFANAVKRIGDLPGDLNFDGYSCGHLCRWCDAVVKATLEGEDPEKILEGVKQL